MDDTAWHASISGMFKNSLPTPHPTLCGETLPKSHRMLNRIAAVFHYLALHKSYFAENNKLSAWYKSKSQHCPISDFTSEMLLRLQLLTPKNAKDQGRITRSIKTNST